MLQADLVFTDNSIGKVSVRERYQIPITSLLSTSHTQEVKTEQNNFVKGFIVNDIPNTEFPEHLKALQNLTFSPDCMFELLDIIQKQEIELALLREKKIECREGC